MGRRRGLSGRPESVIKFIQYHWVGGVKTNSVASRNRSVQPTIYYLILWVFSCSSSLCSNLRDEDMKPEVDFVFGLLLSSPAAGCGVAAFTDVFRLRFGGYDASSPVLSHFWYNLRVVWTLNDSACSQFLCYLSSTPPVALVADRRDHISTLLGKTLWLVLFFFKPVTLFLDGAEPSMQRRGAYFQLGVFCSTEGRGFWKC